MPPLTSGLLAEGVVVYLLRQVYMERGTGLLHFRSGDKRGSLCLIDGEIVWGTTNLLECRLGACLARYGRVSEWQLDEASAVVKMTGRRLGQVLVDMGILDEKGLAEALALHVKEMMAAVCNWNDGQWDFEPHAPQDFRGFDDPVHLPMAELIMDMVWSIEAPDTIRRGLGDTERVLRPSTDDHLRARQLQLTPEDGFIFSRVDGGLRAKDILEICGLDRLEGERRLFALLCTGVIEYAPKTVPKTGHAPRARPAAELPPAPKVEAAPSAKPVVVAEPVQQAEPEPPAPTLSRKERLRQLESYLQEPDRQMATEHELREILTADPGCADAYYLLGLIAKRAGAGKRAQAFFRKATELKPKHRARFELGDAAPAPTDTGFFKKFLRS
jgi:hypothetical protein